MGQLFVEAPEFKPSTNSEWEILLRSFDILDEKLDVAWQLIIAWLLIGGGVLFMNCIWDVSCTSAELQLWLLELSCTLLVSSEEESSPFCKM